MPFRLVITSVRYALSHTKYVTLSCQLTSPPYPSHHVRCVLHQSKISWSCQYLVHMTAALSVSPQAVPLTGITDS